MISQLSSTVASRKLAADSRADSLPWSRWWLHSERQESGNDVLTTMQRSGRLRESRDRAEGGDPTLLVAEALAGPG